MNEGGAMTGFNNDQAIGAHSMSPPRAVLEAPRTRSGRRAFLLHLGEMLIAMFAGMVVLGGVLEGALALAGASLADASATVMASVMAFNMTAPMVWWMLYRGHPARHSWEMGASMVVPTVIVLALHWAGIVAASAVMLAQHVVMIPAMVAVMLWRYDHYSH
jgi:hypothetical protein